MTNQEISVLLVGDRNIYTAGVETMLRHTRWNVAKAQNVTDAIAMLAQRQFHAVLCQNAFEHQTWRDVARAVERLQPHAAVIVLFKGDEDTITDSCSDAYDLLPVPCSARDLYDAVTNAWHHSMQEEHAETAASKPA